MNTEFVLGGIHKIRWQEVYSVENVNEREYYGQKKLKTSQLYFVNLTLGTK